MACAWVEAARALLGVPFCHQGRSRQGLDCLGLLILSAHAAGLRFGGYQPLQLDEGGYGPRPDTDYLAQRLGAYLSAVPRQAMQVGDVLLLRVEGRAQHLALVMDYPYAAALGMIHAYAPARRVVEHRLDDDWQRAIARVYRP